MQQNQKERRLRAEPALTLRGCGAEQPSLVKVLMDFLQGASRYVMEDDGGACRQEPPPASSSQNLPVDRVLEANE